MEAPGCADPGAVAGGPSLPTSNGAGQLYRAGAPLDGRGLLDTEPPGLAVSSGASVTLARARG